MVTIYTILHTVLSRFLLVFFFLFISVPLIVCLLLPKKLLVNNKVFMFVTQLFYWFCIKFSLVSITYKGLNNIPDEPCIIVANHQSSFDIPLVGAALRGRPHIWLSWAELAKGPILQFIVPRVSVLVDMTSPVRGLRTLIQAIEIVKKHSWDLIIFPEGGRYTDGSVHNFFGGFAVIAKKVNRPVVPFKIIGVQKTYPPHTFLIFNYPITVIIGKPMMIEPNETEQAFKERVYHWFTAEAEE